MNSLVGWHHKYFISSDAALWRTELFSFCLHDGANLALLFLRRSDSVMLISWMSAWGCIATVRKQPVNLSVIGYLTAGTYFLAALLKLNSNFFNADISCAHRISWNCISLV